ncbi:MAG: AraC family transcriptional regulator [Negativicutes bacterium]|nr:AraC family transcriptional regulator [Negativicutes bacterium]
MSNLKERVAYLQGLAKGLNVSDNSAEGKLLVNIVETLDSFAEEINCLHSAHQDLENYVETIDEDLTDVEEEVFEDTEVDDDYVEVECPGCHETVTFEAGLLDEDDALEVTCPHCGEVVYDNMLEYDLEEDVDDEVVVSRTNHPGL